METTSPIFNKEICSVGNDIHTHGEELGNLLTQLFKEYTYFNFYNGPFTRYIEMLENKYNGGTLNIESKDLMDKAEVKYNDLKDTLKFKGNSKV